MKEFKKTKPLLYLLQELPEGETIVVDNRQCQIASVRTYICTLRKLGYDLKATTKGLYNKIAVTKLSNNN